MHHTHLPSLTALGAGLRIVKFRLFGRVRRSPGETAEAICHSIVATSWTKHYPLTGRGNYDYFWIRDFGTVVEALLRQGHTERVRHTIAWALTRYQRGHQISLCITKHSVLFNSPECSIDALPWLLHAIVVSGYELHDRDRHFLERQLRRYADTFLDASGDIKAGSQYAELRDAALYDRSAYAVTMVARLATCAQKLGLSFPYDTSHYRTLLQEHYWTGDYFKADRATTAFSAECALFPFVLGVITDKSKLARTLDFIRDQRLAEPYPMRYGRDSDAQQAHFRWWGGRFGIMKNYAGTTIWTWHGAFYLALLREQKRPEYQAVKQRMDDMILRYGTFPELLHPDGNWYVSTLYRGDYGMIWAALYLDAL